MTSTQTRLNLVNDVERAVRAGARQRQACAMIGIAATTLRRWKPAGTDQVLSDQRTHAIRPQPGNQLASLNANALLRF